jgi:hypothetical protein
MLYTFLKVKHKSLADEAKVIRKEENKLYRSTKWLRTRQEMEAADELRNARMELRDHRKAVVGFEARATYLALAYLKGKPMEYVEKNFKGRGNAFYYHWADLMNRVAQIVAKYENIKAYRWKSHRRDLGDVIKEVEAWVDKHPYYSSKTEDKKAA